ALLWADLKQRRARGTGAGDTRAEARAILGEAEEVLGSCPALARERQRLDGAGERVPAPAAETAWERVVLGRSLLRSGQLDRAAEELGRAADLRPQDFWAN